MLKWVAAIAVFVFMHYYIYKRISPVFGISTRWNVFF